MRDMNIKEFGAVGDGITLDTLAIQDAIDAAAELWKEENPVEQTGAKKIAAKETGNLADQVKVIIPKGTYLTGSIFLQSNMELHFEDGAELIGSTNEADHPKIHTRVAGIEMDWIAALLNIYEKENVTVTGKGILNGQGQHWWNKYWGEDEKSGLRKDYDAKGLRWVVDYDCYRPINFLVYSSKNILIKEITSRMSGFWNLHICYSEHVHVDGICISENYGPSTDGIDIDSSRHILVENCETFCNDDSICLKAGRDGDGLEVNRVCEDIEIRNCNILKGCGVTIGSENSGGIKDVYIHDLTYHNTDCGFRIKSARTRGGFIRNIRVEHLSMTNVQYPFSWVLNWHPLYSYCEIPKDYEGEIPEHWHTLTKPVPEGKGLTQIENILIQHVDARITEDRKVSSRAFEIQGYPEKPMRNISFEDISIEADEFGRISAVENMQWNKVTLHMKNENNPDNDVYDNR